MPSFFSFEQGTQQGRHFTDATPALGRFRAVPPPSPASNALGGNPVNIRSRNSPGLSQNARRTGLASFFSRAARVGARERGNGGGRSSSRSINVAAVRSLLTAGGRGSVHIGYGALVVGGMAGADNRSSSAGGWNDHDDGHNGGDDDDDDDVDDVDAENDAHYQQKGGMPLLLWRLRRLAHRLDRIWVTPRPGAVRRVVEPWWSRWLVLVVLPAALAAAWCAVPFPQYPLPDEDEENTGPNAAETMLKKMTEWPSHVSGLGRGIGVDISRQGNRRVPGHGEARVQVNFWFFLFVYYGLYNLTALIWITKVFNLYSLNWWPRSLGLPMTVTAIAVVSLAAPIPIYLTPETRFLTVHNTAWITWSFVIMAMPVAIAFCILMTNERHLGLRHSLSETQRIFTSSWWAGEPELFSDGSYGGYTAGGGEEASSHHEREARRTAAALDADRLDALLLCQGNEEGLAGEEAGRRDSEPQLQPHPPLPPQQQQPQKTRRQTRTHSMPIRQRVGLKMRRRWLPASFVRFIWFCLALTIGLLAYVIGEAYAEIYLRTLPHNNAETVVYVYGWIVTVYLLDGLTGWILGGNEGQRVGSYPLSWIFKLYFQLTYQTYVRALYARLRSPSQFILLQVLSSSGLIVVTPLLMSAPLHWLLSALGLNGQSYGSYQKTCVRNVFIRFLAENASMLAFLGSVAVLHFGANKDVYPYFAFDGDDRSFPGEEGYNFNFTFYASSITWTCELATAFIVVGLIRCIYGVDAVTEGRLDLVVWPELLPTSVAVMLHVLQNMLFSIIRLQFH